jgi:hypothetical protein
MNNPKYIIVHHSGGTDADPMADSSNYTFEQCNQDHKVRFNFISTLGYYVGYQYFIDKAGKITQARSDSEEGAHTIGKNLESLGVCMAGNFDATLPTEAQKTTLKAFIKEKMDQYSIPTENVVPHRTFAHKTCYGKLLEDTWAQNLIKEEAKLEVPPVIETPPVLTEVVTKQITMKEHLVSFLHTFIAVFISTVTVSLSVVPAETLFSPELWTTSFVAGIIVGAVRAAVKAGLPIVIDYVKSMISNVLK